MKNFITSIVLLCCIFTVNAQIINVPGDKATIQAGIDSASNGDTVLVAEGTYLENIRIPAKNITLASQFILDEDTSHIRKTIIDGSSPTNADTASTIFINEAGESSPTICGLTITGGKGTMVTTGETARVGGGLYINSSACVIENNIITENTIDYNFTDVTGAGMYYNMGNGYDLVIRNNSITQNHVTSTNRTRSGGLALHLYNVNFSTVIIEGNIISGNTVTAKAERGCEAGGMSIYMGLPTNCDFKIRNNLISDNELHGPGNATYAGAIQIKYFEPGGYYVDDEPAPEIYNNIITGNTANPGGGGAIGIWTDWNNHLSSSVVRPQPVIINNTVADNISAGLTGIFNWRSFPLLMNNIFWDEVTNPENNETGNVEIPAYGTNNGKIYAIQNLIKDGFDDEGRHLDINNYDFDPGFAKADSFGLAESSGCVGRGTGSFFLEGVTYTAPASDYYESVRPNAVDMCTDLGAIESEYGYAPCGVGVKKIVSPKDPPMIYPNPVSDQITIRLMDGRMISRIEILDATGRTLTTYTDVNSQEITIPRGDLSQGIYFLRVYADAVMVEKIIVR